MCPLFLGNLTGTSACLKATFADRSDVISCTERDQGLGTHALAQLAPTDIVLAMACAKVWAKKRWARRSINRAAKGRATVEHFSKCTEEHTRVTACVIFSRALDYPATEAETKVALRIQRIRRPMSRARAHTIA